MLKMFKKMKTNNRNFAMIYIPPTIAFALISNIANLEM